MVPLSWYLILSAILFSLGVLGFLLKRNIITIFMSIELMLNAVNLSFIAFANYWNSNPGKLPSGAEVVQEPMAQDYGFRDCAFRDPAGNLVRIQERH